MSGSTVKAGILAGVMFGVAMGAFCLIMWSVGEAAAAGVGGGVVFGILMLAVMAVMTRRTAANRPDFGSETVIHEGLANHRKGMEARGGWLYLTGERLHFKSHGFNVQNKELTIPLDRVAGASTDRTLGIIPNRLIVTLKDGAHERFVVQGAGAWERAIAAVCATASA